MLGKGAQASVWLGFDPRLEREVAGIDLVVGYPEYAGEAIYNGVSGALSNTLAYGGDLGQNLLNGAINLIGTRIGAPDKRIIRRRISVAIKICVQPGISSRRIPTIHPGQFPLPLGEG